MKAASLIDDIISDCHSLIGPKDQRVTLFSTMRRNIEPELLTLAPDHRQHAYAATRARTDHAESVFFEELTRGAALVTPGFSGQVNHRGEVEYGIHQVHRISSRGRKRRALRTGRCLVG